MTTKKQVQDIIDQILEKRGPAGGIKRVVWIAAGGSNGGNYPAHYFMEHESARIASSMFTSNEFVLAPPAYIDGSTLAVIVSMRGTAETIEAARRARELGAATIAVYVDESDLTEVCDFKVPYESLAVDESDMGKTNSAVTLMIAMELVNHIEGLAFHDEAMAAFDAIDGIYRQAVELTSPRADAWAIQHADKPCINVMGSGPTYAAAYVFSICNIQEMLQIDSCTINSCEFFHGPFEILDEQTSLFQIVSVGRCRPADERAIAFLEKFGGERVHVLDAADLGLEGLGEPIAEYLSHLIISPILNNVYMRALAKVIGKDYLSRRYMWQMPY